MYRFPGSNENALIEKLQRSSKDLSKGATVFPENSA
jgi:hypothetical protein